MRHDKNGHHKIKGLQWMRTAVGPGFSRQLDSASSVWPPFSKAARKVIPALCLALLVLARSLAVFAQEDPEINEVKRALSELEASYRNEAAVTAAEALVFLTTAKYGEMHSKTMEALSLLGQAADNNGEAARAAQLWHRSLDIGAHIFGEDVPAMEPTLRMLANRLCRPATVGSGRNKAPKVCWVYAGASFKPGLKTFL